MDSNHQLNISPIAKLSTFIKKYPDESLHQHLYLLQESFPKHRAVRGDGNCFYRAFAFLYLANNPCQDYFSTFPQTIWSYKKPNSSIRSNQQFQDKLLQTWNRYIRGLSTARNRAEKQKKLQALFNDMEIFDELMIGYFRSVNYQHMKAKKNKLPCDKDDFEKELKRVAQFGSESEGIELYSLAEAMNVKITIISIDKEGFHPYQYMEHLENKEFYLFLRPGHYDIVYPDEGLSESGENRFEKMKESRLKTTFLNNFKFLSPKIKDQMNNFSKKAEDGASFNKIDLYKGVQTPSGPRISEKLPETKVVKKTSSLSANEASNDGKFDFRYKTQGRSRVYDNSINDFSIPTNRSSLDSSKRKSTVITSTTEPLYRLSMEVFALTGTAILGYILYNYIF